MLADAFWQISFSPAFGAWRNSFSHKNEVTMNETSMALMALMGLCLVAMIAPSILKMNKGKALVRVAMWLVIVLALGLAYSLFGPGAKSPTMSGMPAVSGTSETTAIPAPAPPPPPPPPMPEALSSPQDK